MPRNVETVAAEGGLYSRYRFNDEHLRRLGLHCEEFFPGEDIPTVLRKLAKETEGYASPTFGFRSLIIKADEVLETPSVLKPDTYALYVPLRGVAAQSIPKCTDLGNWDGSPENHPSKKGGSSKSPFKR